MRMRLAILLLALVTAGVSSAEEEPQVAEAREHFRVGQKLYAAGDFVGALREFEAARQIKAIPEFDYNIGVCYERLGHARDAIASFRQFIVSTNDASALIETQQHIDRLEAALHAAPPPPPAPPPPAAVVAPPVAAPPAAPRSYTLPTVMAVGAVALAAIGATLVLTVQHEYENVSASWDRQPTPELVAEADYMKTRLEAGYALFATAGVAAIVDIVLWARTARRPDPRAPTASLLAPRRSAAGVQLGWTF